MPHCAPLPLHDPRKPMRAHMVGIAGAGMAALADVLLAWGWRLSGSDLAAQPSGRLAAGGVTLHVGHAAAYLPADADLVIASSAVRPDNPELRRAAELGIPALTYAEMLGRLMRGQRGLAVAGTHGKSTTTAMAAQIFVDAMCDPTAVFGATPVGGSSGGRAGQGPLVLVEACEYLANFLNLRPQQAVILGIEPDHFDCYDSTSALEQAFSRFAALVPRDGLLLVRHDCAVARRIAAPLACRLETFGIGSGSGTSATAVATDGEADWSAFNLQAWRGCYRFDLSHRGRMLGEVSLRVPGRHNVLNALAAAALAHANEVTSELTIRGLGRFRGLHRRLEMLGTWGGVLLVDDYAHHPTEVAASLETLRVMEPGRRLWCVFQPHQASRTEHLLDELAASLQNADTVLVADIFRAREGPARRGEVTAADLARQVRARGTRVPDVHTAAEIEQLLTTQLTPGDVLVTMGAGDIGRIGYGLMERFRESRAAG